MTRSLQLSLLKLAAVIVLAVALVILVVTGPAMEGDAGHSSVSTQDSVRPNGSLG